MSSRRVGNVGKSETYPYYPHICIWSSLLMSEHMQDSFPETLKIAIAVSIALEHLDLVVTAFGKAVGIWNIKRVQNSGLPINESI